MEKQSGRGAIFLRRAIRTSVNVYPYSTAELNIYQTISISSDFKKKSKLALKNKGRCRVKNRLLTRFFAFSFTIFKLRP